MNLAAFAVVVARERETPYGDDLRALYGLGADRPWLAWPMTIAMLSLAGFPATAGFFGKIYLIEAAIDNQYAFLGVAIVLGSAISLAYYLRVVAAVWLSAPDEARGSSRVVAPGTARPAIAGGSQEADGVLDAPAVQHRRGLGHGRRGGLRDRDDRDRGLPRAAAERRQRRGRGVAGTCCSDPRGEFSPRAPISRRCASPTPYRRPGLRRVRRAPRSGVRRRGGGRGGGVGAADRGAGRAAGQARDLPRRGRDLHAAGGARGRARAVPGAGAHRPGAARRAGAGGEGRAGRLAAGPAPLGRHGGGLVRGRRGGRGELRGRAAVRGRTARRRARRRRAAVHVGADVGVPDRRGRVSLRAPLGAHGDADRRAARDPARRRPPAGAGLDLQGGRRVRRVRRGGRAAARDGGVAGRRVGRGDGPPDRARRARHVVRPRRRRDGRASSASSSARCSATTPARPRSRSRPSTAARSSCGSAPPRACTASSRRRAR